MAKQSNKLKQIIINKQQLINSAKQTLKQEFVGLDNIIEEVVDSVSSWYFFPDLQEKPVVINLWGLTGVGKTSLVRRLSELLNFHNKFYHFDLGDVYNKGQSIEDQLEYVFGNVNGFPIMIALDEFQHARTIEEHGLELNHSSSRVIWELLDSGKYQIPEYKYEVRLIFQLKLKLNRQLKNGVKVENGRVVSERKSFLRNLLSEDEDLPFIFKRKKPNSKKLLFVQSSYYEIVYSLAKEMFESIFDVEEKLLSLNGPETIEFLNEVYEIGNSPKIINCSKSIIFVIGNLDEAYWMSNNYSADMSADEFHEQSLKINIADVKEALKYRFRNEQIARLGNNHIIYPALSNDSYKKIIRLELKDISKKFEESQEVKLNFDSSVEDLIFSEGVFPTQGVRPISSTIHQIVNTRLGKIVSQIHINRFRTDELVMKITEDDRLEVAYFKGGKMLYKRHEQQRLKLKELRKNKKDDMQAISAVHESGHAIIAIILLKTVPEIIYSQTTDTDASAFVYTKFKNRFVQKNEICHRVAMDMGGLGAERIIFGDNYITTGASSDIKSASYFATSMIKESGMGKTVAAFQVAGVNTNKFLFDVDNEINTEVKVCLVKGMDLAERILKKQKTLLLRMSDYLCDNRRMDKQTIMEFVKNYAVDFDLSIIEKKSKHLYYRELLKSKVDELKQKEQGKLEENYDISLNKGKEYYGGLMNKILTTIDEIEQTKPVSPSC